MLAPSEARAILTRCNAHGDYHALSSAVVDSLLAEADRMKYRKPKDAPGSRGRMFHGYLSRRACGRD